MIIRLLVIDPNGVQPKTGKRLGTDILVYQLPENSREFNLLTDLLTAANIEWTVVKSVATLKPKKGKQND